MTEIPALNTASLTSPRQLVQTTVPADTTPAAGADSTTAAPTSSQPAGTVDAKQGASNLVIPDWVKDAVFYQIFPERFENGDTGNDPFGVKPWGTKPTNFMMMGGDLDGITKRMDYLKDLGVNALYLNPVFSSQSNHKYDITDYENIDESFGGNVAFTKMMDTAHKSGVKVMVDGVFNHTSHKHEWFKDVREKGPKSEHWDKFDVKNFPIEFTRDKDGILRSDDYNSWWDYATLPELETEKDSVRDYFLRDKNSVVKKWITEGKVDGWRMDVADEVEPSFWQEARKEIKATNPDTYILAENWQDASSMLQGDQFDGAMNYKYFQQPAVKFFAKKNISADEFARQLQNPYSKEAQFGAFNILDSHDTPRFVTEADGDWYRLRPAAIFQMTYVGAPVVYYGDELGMEGGGDPDSRRSFNWDLAPSKRAAVGPIDAVKTGARVSQQQRAQQTFDLYKSLIATRKEVPALRRGDFSVIATHNDDKTLSYRRSMTDSAQDAIVAINNDVVGHDMVIPVSEFAQDGTKYVDRLSGNTFAVENGAITMPEVDGNFGAVLVRELNQA